MSNLFSDFQVRKATLAALGGDITKDYRSVYDIDLAILEATKQSGAIQPVVVETLPETGEKGKLYFVPNDDPKSQDNYKEYVWVNNAWECVGNAAVDLTGYAKISDVNSSIATEDTSIRNYVEGKINTVNNDIIEDENIVAEAIYTIKNQLDSSLAEKADITTVDASLALKADKSDTLPLISAGNFTGYPAGVQATLNKSGLSINSAGEVYASNLTYDQLKTATGTRYWIGDQALRNYVTGYIAEQDFANTEEVDASLNTKADWQIVDASLGLKADKITVDASLAEKADKTYVDSSLALYTKKTEIANFAKVSTLTQAEYEALEVKDPQTIYIISDAE